MFARVDYSAGLIGCLGGPFFLPLLRCPKRSPFHERKRSFLEAIVAVLPCYNSDGTGFRDWDELAVEKKQRRGVSGGQRLPRKVRGLRVDIPGTDFRLYEGSCSQTQGWAGPALPGGMGPCWWWAGMTAGQPPPCSHFPSAAFAEWMLWPWLLWEEHCSPFIPVRCLVTPCSCVPLRPQL